MLYVNEDNIPYMQVYKQHQPEIWSPELRQGTMFDILDEYCEMTSKQKSGRKDKTHGRR